MVTVGRLMDANLVPMDFIMIQIIVLVVQVTARLASIPAPLVLPVKMAFM